MDGRRRAVRAATVVTVVVVVWVLPDLVSAILSCKDGFASRNNSTSVSPECYRKQWWRAVEQNKVPGMCLSNLQMSTPCQNNVTCEGLRSRREVMHPKEHIRDKKILCSEIPAVPANMVLARSADGFLGTCREGYGFSSPFIQSLGIRCQAGVWVKNHTHPCRPQCSNQCHNGGTCIDVETCLCPPGTAGPKCGTLVWGTCRTDVKWQNVIVKAIVQGLLLQCPRGYKLLQYKPYEHWLLQCKARRFEEPPGVTWDQENPCRPVCEPPCHEGATCVAPGKCDCGDGIACADCETRQLCALPVVRHGAAYRLAPQLSRVSCFGERLPAARSRNLLLRCSKDHWVTAGGKTVAANQVNCSFSCDRECQNGGRCVGLNRCQCRDGFVGSFCGHPVCGSTPLRVPHALYSMTSSAGVVSGTVRCNDQYRLASGEQQTSFQCRGGTWYFSGDMSGHKLVECHPLCSPPCVNRGTCLAPGHCLCSGGFTGKYCELRPTSTTDGMRCVFPFSNGHKIYSSCVIADDKIPWCPTQVNLDRKPLAWQMCNTTHNLEKVVGTISGRSCAFPFKWNGTTWWKCAHDDKDRYWCATHVTTNGHILQTDFCWLDHGLPHTQPECHSSMGCPLPSIPGASVVEIPFAAYPGLATNTATSTTTTTTKPITTIANEMPTLVIPQIPGMPPLPPLPPLFPLLPDLVPPPPPPTPPRMLPQPPPLPPMPFVPPPPPPMPPPLLLLQQPMPPQMPQPIPVFMPPSFQPQPVMQLAPIVPLQQLQPSPPQSVQPPQLLLPPPLQSVQAPPPLPLHLLSQSMQLSPPQQSVKLAPPPQSTQLLPPPQSMETPPPRYKSIPSFHGPVIRQEPLHSAHHDPVEPPLPPTTRPLLRATRRTHAERPTEPTTQYPDYHDPDEPIPRSTRPPQRPTRPPPTRSTRPPSRPTRDKWSLVTTQPPLQGTEYSDESTKPPPSLKRPLQRAARSTQPERPTPEPYYDYMNMGEETQPPSQPERLKRPQKDYSERSQDGTERSRRSTSRPDRPKSRRRQKATEPPTTERSIRPKIQKQRRRRPRPTEPPPSRRPKSRGTHLLRPLPRPQRTQEETER